MRSARCLAAAAIAMMAGSGASAAPLPRWMLGDWSVKHIYQSTDKPYSPPGGPAVWWQDKLFHISGDRLAFADWVCQGPHAVERRGRVADLLQTESGSTPEDLQMPAGAGEVSYYQVRCDRFLIWHNEFQGHPGHYSDVGIDHDWNIIFRSKTEIAMPFMGATFVVFGKPGPSA